MTNNHSAQSYALLSIIAAVLTISLKLIAYRLTGSVGLFSDAAESLVNLVAALVALWALRLAARPPDDTHAFGHSKAEYFASGLEGALILLAAGSIGLTAWDRLQHPQPLERLVLGTTVSLIAAGINGGVAWILLRAGRRLRSITLQANAHHLFTDVWTTIGVVVGISLVNWTGWLLLDPLIALIVAANIVWTGIHLLHETGNALLDTALSPDDQAVIEKVLSSYKQQGIAFHALRTRRAGLRRFVSLHVLVPGSWSVQHGHDLCEEIELAINRALHETNVTTHLEPLEDPSAWHDELLDRVTIEHSPER
jgi:cation diffusion facilitator family transporter